MKNQIIAKSGVDCLNFYLVNRYGTYYMFTQKYSRAVFVHFRNGRSENEVRSFRDWDRDRRLVKVIEKLPAHIDSTMKYYVQEDILLQKETSRASRTSRRVREVRWTDYGERAA